MSKCRVTFAALLAVLGAAAFLVAGSESAKILAVFPMPSRSHMIALTSITRALASKGHDVTVFTSIPPPFKETNSKIKINVMGNPFEETMKKSAGQMFEKRLVKIPFIEMVFLWQWGEGMVNHTFNHPQFQAEVNRPGAKFDLILAELFFFQEAFVALGHKFDCPVVAVNPFGTYQWLSDITGNPVNPSWVPSTLLGMPSRMDLWQRTANALYYFGFDILTKIFHVPRQQALVDKFIPNAPPLQTLLRSKLALTLVNNHFSLTQPEPLAPNVVEVGGLHISETIKPLPKDLQDYMDGAKDGVVFFSLGSNLRTEYLPQETTDDIFGALGALKQRVLLRWDGPGPAKMPANIMVKDWLPQSDLLGHPNLRLFVTHGGLLSTQESVYRGVPLIGISVFGDQVFNMRLAENKGFCIHIPFPELSREKLDAALQTVLGDPKFKKAVASTSLSFRARPTKPLDLALFWVEHVLANGGDHLRPSSTELWWFQLLLLDVLLVVSAPVILLLLCCRAICCRRKPTAAPATKSKKKTN